jgi:hypothetical protein
LRELLRHVSVRVHHVLVHLLYHVLLVQLLLLLIHLLGVHLIGLIDLLLVQESVWLTHLLIHKVHLLRNVWLWLWLNLRLRLSLGLLVNRFAVLIH